MTAPRSPSRGEIQEIGDTVEAVILGGPRKYTSDEVVALVGIDRERALRIWRSMGFPDTADDDRAFTGYDVEALQRLDEWRAVAGVDDESIVSITRVMAQFYAQMATWEGQLAVDTFLKDLDASGSVAALTTFTERLLPMLERTHIYLWRRQVAGYLARRIAVGQEQLLSTSEAAVGFADISGYTALTRDASEVELRRLLDDFEAAVTDAVGMNTGRVVKTIGDAVLFTAEHPAVAANIALHLLAQWPPTAPPLRVGLASGAIVDRLGDVFGSTVNIASRLTSISALGEVLIDQNMADALADDERFQLDQNPPAAVRGYKHLPSWRLTKTPGRT